jgi:hypothetical protein
LAVNDGFNDEVYLTFIISIYNNPPLIQKTLRNFEFDFGNSISIALPNDLFTDPDNDDLDISGDIQF